MEGKEQFIESELWASLSNGEKYQCLILGRFPRPLGVSINDLEYMGANFIVLDELVEKEIVQRKEIWEFAQEALDKNSKLPHLQEIVNRKSPNIRYRLADEELHNAINEFK